MMILARNAVTIAALAFLVAGGGAAGAQSVKELMGKAQRESERRAVEDLVRKLQGGDKPGSAAKQPSPSAPTPPAVASPAPVNPPEIPPAASAPVAPEPVRPAVADPSPPSPPLPEIAAPKAPEQPAEPPQPPETAPSQQPSVATPAPPPRPSVVPAPAVAEPTPPAPPSEPARPEPTPQPAIAAPTPSQPPAKPPAEEADVASRNTLPSVDIEVYFSSGSARITPRAVAILTPLGKALSDSRLAHATFLIAGHTDAVGSADYNRELSRRRAESVRRFLIERFDIDGKRLVSRGYGFDQLKLPDRPQAPENRRVQIVNWTSQVPR